MVRMATEEARREPTPRGYHIAKRVAAQVSVASECVLNKKTYGLMPWHYRHGMKSRHAFALFVSQIRPRDVCNDRCLSFPTEICSPSALC